MPSAMSRPSEPVETVSTSIDLSFLPSRMIEPLPKLRSIWESAASRAFDLSMEEPSTRRSAAVAIAPTPYDRDSEDRQRSGSASEARNVHVFVLSSQYVLFAKIGCRGRRRGELVPRALPAGARSARSRIAPLPRRRRRCRCRAAPLPPPGRPAACSSRTQEPGVRRPLQHPLLAVTASILNRAM